MSATDQHQTTTETTTMRAIVADGWGDTGVLREAIVPRPAPGLTEIEVEVHAAALNPVDLWTRATGGFGQLGDPAIIGWDVSGVVTRVGGGATPYEVGDEVFGMPLFPAQAGAYAEYVVGPAHQFAPKPAGLSHAQASALPLVGLTAWQGLVEVGHLEAGQRVLIHAAGGGLGHIAVQIATARGVHVIGTASAGKHEWLRSLGVDELIDYRAVDFTSAVSDLDLVFDTVGDDTADRSVDVLRDGGRLVTVKNGSPSDAAAAKAAARGISTRWILVEPDRLGLLELTKLVDAGKLEVEVAQTFPLSEVAAAHTLLEQGSTAGKIVLEVR
jgi:NADPH:quinone reductase-like Zn-dependent oxidoreductase